ncbi:hypothetical protein, partial [Klebsiella pneumoniae]|uniref:hypothetical protein n=1 Tax=Klebsiella pneumoniae TaxID=573 RepID=UPI003EBFFDBE
MEIMTCEYTHTHTESEARELLAGAVHELIEEMEKIKSEVKDMRNEMEMMRIKMEAEETRAGNVEKQLKNEKEIWSSIAGEQVNFRKIVKEQEKERKKEMERDVVKIIKRKERIVRETVERNRCV